MRALLDVNVLIALLDPDHAFHLRAHRWWLSNQRSGWSSCPLIENGVVRIMSNPGYSRSVNFSASQLIEQLRQFVSRTDHEFWPDDVSLRDEAVFAGERLHSSRSLTDSYLLALASRHGGRLATFDQGIPMSSVRNATAANLCAL